MLKKIEVQNFKNFQDNLIFDLSASDYKFNSECVSNGVVKTALIFGKNSSGKSNLGLAIFDLIEHLTDNDTGSLKDIRNYLNLNSSSKHAHFKFEFQLDGKEVVYEYTKNESANILSELLTIEKTQVVNYKLGQPLEVLLKGAESLNKNIDVELNLSALKYIEKNTNLDLRSPNNKVFKAFMLFVSDMVFLKILLDQKAYMGKKSASYDTHEDILKRGNLSDFQDFLNRLGINYELVEIDDGGRKGIGVKFKNKTVPFNLIGSTGTISLTFFYYIYQRFNNAGDHCSLLFLDEFDASYHFSLSKSLVAMLKELNVQVFLTTHNTSLLDNDIIRPDCGFIIESNAIKALHHLTDKELREAHNLEKLFRAGKFEHE